MPIATRTFVRLGNIAAAAATAALAACDLDQSPLAPQAALTESNVVQEFVRPQFNISVRTDGPYLPGNAIRVTADFTANLPASGARLSITFPELASLALTGENPAILPTQAKLQRQAEWALNLAQGSRGTRSTLVRFSKPGYYRAVIRIEDPSMVAIMNGMPIQNIVTREIWVLVADKGGQQRSISTKGLFRIAL